jgi:hypothetical protein
MGADGASRASFTDKGLPFLEQVLFCGGATIDENILPYDQSSEQATSKTVRRTALCFDKLSELSLDSASP